MSNSLATLHRRPSTSVLVGAIAIVVALLAFPVVFLMSMTPLAAILGDTLKQDVDARYEGSELLELNV